MSISNKIVDNEIYSILEIKKGRLNLNIDLISENNGNLLQYVSNEKYSEKFLTEDLNNRIKKNIANVKMTAFQHKVIEFLTNQEKDIIDISNISFLKNIDFYEEFYKNTASIDKYNRQFLDLGITRFLIGKDEKNNIITNIIQPLSFQITIKKNGNKNLKLSLNPFLKKDLIVGFQNIVLTKNEDYNRFIMFMTRATCGYNNNISIPCEKVANSILKVKEHYRTKKNRHNKLCEILKLFFLNEKKNICYLKLMDNNEFIVFYKENLPYKKENIREIYLCSDR